MKRYWHYTKALNLPGIKHERRIKRTVTYFEGDRPCVWLSVNNFWDYGARKIVPHEAGYIVSCDPVTVFKYGLKALVPIRIEVDPSKIIIFAWRDHKKTIPAYVAEQKENGGRNIGANTGEWFVTYDDIPYSSILSIEKQVAGEWVGLPFYAGWRKEEEGEKTVIIDDIENEGVWFKLSAGGRVQVKTVSQQDYEQIKKQTVKSQNNFVLNPKTGRVEYVKCNVIDDITQTTSYYDISIVAWEGIYDSEGNLIPCNKENKLRLMLGSEKFKRVIDGCLEQLHDRNLQRAGAIL